MRSLRATRGDDGPGPVEGHRAASAGGRADNGWAAGTARQLLRASDNQAVVDDAMVFMSLSKRTPLPY